MNTNDEVSVANSTTNPPAAVPSTCDSFSSVDVAEFVEKAQKELSYPLLPPTYEVPTSKVGGGGSSSPPRGSSFHNSPSSAAGDGSPCSLHPTVLTEGEPGTGSGSGSDTGEIAAASPGPIGTLTPRQILKYVAIASLGATALYSGYKLMKLRHGTSTTTSFSSMNSKQPSVSAAPQKFPHVEEGEVEDGPPRHLGDGGEEPKGHVPPSPLPPPPAAQRTLLMENTSEEEDDFVLLVKEEDEEGEQKHQHHEEHDTEGKFTEFIDPEEEVNAEAEKEGKTFYFARTSFSTATNNNSSTTTCYSLSSCGTAAEQEHLLENFPNRADEIDEIAASPAASPSSRTSQEWILE